MSAPLPDATALAGAIRDGRVTALAVTEACLARIAERDGRVGAWAHVDAALARAQADALDHAAERGPLHGVPIGIKDVLLTRDMPTCYNCDTYEGHAPVLDSACVALLRQAGAVILGKTETVELASIGRPARTRNPLNIDHTPGGSSSGSAAAVADGHVPLTIGTQTGGSIVRPASFCGVWALKPTWGTVSTEGAKPFAPSLDTIGWFGRSARDLALLLDVFAPAPGIPPPSVEGARIAMWRTAGWPRAERATRDAMAAAVGLLKAAGAIVTEVDLPFPGLAEAQLTIMRAEGAVSFLPEYRADIDRLHPRIAAMVRSGGGDPKQWLAAADLAGAARVAFDSLAGEHDAVLSPSTIAEAPRGLANTGDLLFNGLLTLLHAPTVNLPLFHAANGLPVGLTLSGRRRADRTVVAMAMAISALSEAQQDG